LSIEKIRQRVEAMNAISDEPFGMVIVDYMQLLRGNGKTRYERYSNEAEEAKVAAKETDSIWVVLSQVGRPDGAAETYEPGLHDAKESGSIENSAGLVLGISRCDDTHGEALKVRVLKSTKGGAGTTVVANWNVQTLKITERYDGDIIP
jgi:replicative DNA helicase